jgi:hypothetical protein
MPHEWTHSEAIESIVAALTALYLIVTYRILQQNLRANGIAEKATAVAAEATETSMAHTRESNELTRRSVEIAARALQLSERAFEASLRPSLHIVAFHQLQASMSLYKFAVTLANRGGGPAHDLLLESTHVIRASTEPLLLEDLPQISPAEPGSRGSVGRDDEISVTETIEDFPQLFRDIQRGQTNLYFWAVLQYRDLLGNYFRVRLIHQFLATDRSWPVIAHDEEKINRAGSA